MRNKLIVALDINSFDKAKKLIDKLSPYVNIFKVGSELFTSCGSKIIKYIHGKDKKIFLDLKFHDIPNTVAAAAIAVTHLRIFMFTVHVSGGNDMMKKTIEVIKKESKKGFTKPKVLGITILTSKDMKTATEKVKKLALIAKKAGLDGIVCSGKETKRVKKVCGKKFIVVNPGIRPLWAARGDQKRITTPEKAIENGADFIVVGRPITKAKDPVSAAKKILDDLEHTA